MTTKQIQHCKDIGKIPYKVSNKKGEIRYTIGTSQDHIEHRFTNWLCLEITWEEFCENYIVD